MLWNNKKKKIKKKDILLVTDSSPLWENLKVLIDTHLTCLITFKTVVHSLLGDNLIVCISDSVDEI